MGFLEDLLSRVRSRITANDWPPEAVREHWSEVEYYRVRHRNDAGLLLPFAPAYSASSFERQQQYTPVPLAREISRYSASLLFSQPMSVTLEPFQDELDEILSENQAEAFWQDTAEQIAVEGRGGLRVIFDDTVSDEPLITHVSEDKILWDVRHGRFARGGIVVIEAESQNRLDTYRMLEAHEAGLITREVYRGKGHYLGQKVPVNADYLPIELQGFEEREETGLDSPTLIRWDNVPGGRSDLFAIEVLLDRIDEGESLLVEKARKSRPWIFASRELADESGNVDISNLIFMKQNEAAEYLPEQERGRLVEHVQPAMQTTEHVAWLHHLREVTLTLAGYSLASWGLDEGGTADSGTALRLRQQRTQLTRGAKERMARDAISTAVGVALARKLGAPSIAELRPRVDFGDGMPRDPAEDAQEVATLKGVGLISVEEALRTLNPHWTDEEVQEELARLSQGQTEATQLAPDVMQRTQAIFERIGSGGTANVTTNAAQRFAAGAGDFTEIPGQRR